MTSRRTGLTYRVRNIPHLVDIIQLPHLLQSVLDYNDGVKVHSLATAIDHFEQSKPKIATVTFSTTPVTLSGADRSEWIFPKSQTMLPYSLIIDSHFMGLTILNEVRPQDHVMDYIAVTGLAGHAFGSWSSRDRDVDFMWLQDALATRYPHARVWTYGYDTKLVDSESFQNIDDIALSFIKTLQVAGFADPSTKPMSLLAHSLGGIVVKQAMAIMANNPYLESNMLSKIKRLMFFGVPNRGMHIAHLRVMVKERPNRKLIEALGPDSDYLANLHCQFSGLVLTRRIDLLCVYETYKTQVPELENSEWRRTGPYEILVHPHSATHSTSPMQQIPINKDHSELTKLTEGDGSLQQILHLLNPTRLRQMPATLERDDDHGGVTQDAIVERRVSMLDQSFRSNQTSNIPPTRGLSATQVGVERQRESWVTSLRSTELEYRYQTIEPAHAATLGWLFSDETSLESWLQEGTGVFWINGKPGSGKSTVMKFICDKYHARFDQTTHTSNNVQSISAKFFLSLRGSFLQKSIEGLLRSVMYQLLCCSSTLAAVLFSDWQRASLPDSPSWTLHELRILWNAVVVQKEQPLAITLFLDAMDEFDGPPERVAKLVQTMISQPVGSRTSVRALLASRPWNAFKDRFSQYDGIKLEDHTVHDIERYVWAVAGDSDVFSTILQSSGSHDQDEAAYILRHIIHEARGVFLWVKIVLTGIIDRYANGDEVSELKMAVSNLPHEVEDLYQSVLDRLTTPTDRNEAYVMLETLARCERVLSVSKFFCIVRCALTEGLDVCEKIIRSNYWKMPDIATNMFHRRVKSKCGGLIEFLPPAIVQGPEKQPLCLSRVQLMHQSAKDFVLQRNFANSILVPDSALVGENGHSFIARVGLLLLNIWAWPHHDRSHRKSRIDAEIDDSAVDMFLHAITEHERTTGRSQQTLIDRIPEDRFPDADVITSDWMFRTRDHNGRWPVPTRLSFAMHNQLNIWLEANLFVVYDNWSTSQKSLVLFELIQRLDRNEDLYQYLDRLLTHYPSDAGLRKNNVSLWQTLCCMIRYPGNLDMMEKVMELFHRCGCDPNIYTYNLEYMARLRQDPVRYTSRPLHDAVVFNPKLVHVLLHYGADINSLDGHGLTVLDIAIPWLLSRLALGTFADARELMCIIQLLVTMGEKLTSTRYGPTRRRVFDLVGAEPHDNLVAMTQNNLPAEFQATPAFQDFIRQPVLSPIPPPIQLSMDDLPQFGEPYEYDSSITRWLRQKTWL